MAIIYREYKRNVYRCPACGPCQRKVKTCPKCGSSNIEVKEFTGTMVDIRVRLPDGTVIRDRKKSPVSGRTNTEKWAQGRERAIFTDGIKPKVPPKPKVATLDDFWPRFMSDHCVANGQKESGKESKDYGYRTFLKPLFGTTPLNQITTERVAALKAKMIADEYAPATINNTLALLSKLLKFAVDLGVIEVMPCKIQKLKTQKPDTRSYEHDEFGRLLAAAQRLGPNHYLMVLLAGEAGLRKGELVALLQSNCDTRKGVITVEQSQWRNHVSGTKGLAVRHLEMTARLKVALKANRHLRGERVFHNEDGSHISGNVLRRWAQEVQTEAGIKGKGGLHIYRHSFCTHLVAGGVPVTTVQRMAGHQSLSTTSRYLHGLEGETKRAIELLEKVRDRGNRLATDSGDGTFTKD